MIIMLPGGNTIINFDRRTDRIRHG